MLTFAEIMRMTPSARVVWILYNEARDTAEERAALVALSDKDGRTMPDWMWPGMKCRREKKIVFDSYRWYDPFYGLPA